MYDPSTSGWVGQLVGRLESPGMGFSCCCYDRDIDRRLSPAQAVLYGMQKSVKTVIVLSPEFVEYSWSNLKVCIQI